MSTTDRSRHENTEHAILWAMMTKRRRRRRRRAHDGDDEEEEEEQTKCPSSRVAQLVLKP